MGLFYGKFRNLIDYGALVSHLFRHVAEWGNLLIVLKLLDAALAEVPLLLFRLRDGRGFG